MNGPLERAQLRISEGHFLMGEDASTATASLALDPRIPVLISASRSRSRALFVLRQPDHVAMIGAECHQHHALAAQSIDFVKDLAPGQVGETLRQRIQIASLRAGDFAENAIGHGIV